jgi:hypothetical protein
MIVFDFQGLSPKKYNGQLVLTKMILLSYYSGNLAKDFANSEERGGERKEEEREREKEREIILLN